MKTLFWTIGILVVLATYALLAPPSENKTDERAQKVAGQTASSQAAPSAPAGSIVFEGRVFCPANEWTEELYLPGTTYALPVGAKIVIQPKGGKEFEFVVPEGDFVLKDLKVVRLKFPYDYAFELKPKA